MSRGKLHISRSPYHSFYHREETKAQHHSLFRSVVNSQTEMRHSTRLYCLSSLSVLSSPPFFSLGIFCEFIVLWSYETDHMYSNREKGKKRAFDDRIDSLFLTKTFVYFCPIHTQLLLLLLSQLFFVKGQYKLFWDGANRKILNLLISPRKIAFRDLK